MPAKGPRRFYDVTKPPKKNSWPNVSRQDPKLADLARGVSKTASFHKIKVKVKK